MMDILTQNGTQLQKELQEKLFKILKIKVCKSNSDKL